MDRKTYLKEYYAKNKDRLKSEKRKKSQQNCQQSLFNSTVDEFKQKENVMTNVYQVYSSTKKR